MSKRILIAIPETPGTGHVVNAKYIHDGLKQLSGYEVHVAVLGSASAVAGIFGADLTPGPTGSYDLLIWPGLDRWRPVAPRVGASCRVVMHLPPPFCSHLCKEPFVSTGSPRAVKPIALPSTLPFTPVSRGSRLVTADDDYRGYKRREFPQVKPADVHFIVTYLGLTDGARVGHVFDDYAERVIILNFGHHIPVRPNSHVVSLKLRRVSQVEFEDCLLRCTTIYPALTDGANTVATLQALELPYYDLAEKRVMAVDGGAFLNAGEWRMELFRGLKSRVRDADNFAAVKRRTESYYAQNAEWRRGGRMTAIAQFIAQHLR